MTKVAIVASMVPGRIELLISLAIATVASSASNKSDSDSEDSRPREDQHGALG